MPAEDLILVTGATGNTGSTLLQELETARCRGSCDGFASSKDAARTAELAGHG